jgi:membrane-associated phospholipid phosphatase
MDQSLFSGEAFGGQDFFYGLMVPVVLIYLLSYHPKLEKKLLPYRKYCGFIIVVALAVTVGASRVGKALFARARPGDVFRGEYQFSHMLMFGTYEIDEAFSHGSFPSGHTFTAMGLLVIPFILIRTRKNWLITLTFILAILFGIAMGVGRVMAGAHFPGDTAWAIIFSTILTSWIYFKVLKIPEQEGGVFVYTKKFAELRIGLNLVYIEFAIGIIIIAIRYTIIDFMWYWPLAIVLGAVLTKIFLWRLKITQSFEGPN